MENTRAGLLAVLLIPTSLALVFLAVYAGTPGLPAAPSFLVGFVSGLLAVAAVALLYLTGRELGRTRR